ncbi:MAG: hypothetical protein SXV54_25725 [Chloroflexota bacterium]|nr:hypothetical protein [Chloroflexota bacterium]
MRVLILPTRWESRAVLKSLSGAAPDPEWDVPTWRIGNLLIVEPGVGPELTAALLPRFEPLKPSVKEVWLLGWCGGLTPELNAGDLVLSDATISAAEAGGTMQFPHPPPEALVTRVRRLAKELNLRMIVGPVLTSDHVLASVEQKQDGATTGAVAVEMEAGPLARWAAAKSIPFVHLRVVLDPLVSPLPPTLLTTDEHGDFSLRTLLQALTHPREWAALWGLIQQTLTARRALADVSAALTQPGGPLS